MAKGNGATKRENVGDLHIVMTAKGGVGKTFITSLVAQWAISNGKPMRVLDMDQSNAMLAPLAELSAEFVPLMEEKRFVSEKFDAVIRRIMRSDETFLVDVGASTFHDVWAWMHENDIIEVLKHDGRRVVIHSVVTGGIELTHTLGSFDEVCHFCPERQVVVWLNPFLGKIQLQGTEFEAMRVYRQNEHKVLTVATFPLAKEAVAKEVRDLGIMGKTLLDIESNDSLDFLSKHRLTRYRTEVFEKIATVWEAIDARP